MKPLSFQDIILRAVALLGGPGRASSCSRTTTRSGRGRSTRPPRCARSIPTPWRCAYVQPSRRPTDGRYGENPNRLQHYYQYQVILMPSPDDVLDLYFDSLRAIGIDPAEHDVRLVEDDWESPTLGAWGLGWEVWLNGMECTQFTYFQQVGGFECRPVPAEITYGLERLAMYIQGVDSVYDIEWVEGVTYGDVFLRNEQEYSAYNFEIADTDDALPQLRGRTRRSAAACSRRGSSCRPTTSCSSARTRSTCSTRAVPSRSPSGWASSCASARWPRRAARPTSRPCGARRPTRRRVWPRGAWRR